jgi:hypothetical protein
MNANMTLNIMDAILMDGFRIALSFDDGKRQTVDFKHFLVSSHHLDVRAFLDPDRFAQFELRQSELVWSDYDLCFPIMDLYNNTLLHQGMHLVAA